MLSSTAHMAKGPVPDDSSEFVQFSNMNTEIVGKYRRSPDKTLSDSPTVKPIFCFYCLWRGSCSF